MRKEPPCLLTYKKFEEAAAVDGLYQGATVGRYGHDIFVASLKENNLPTLLC